MNNEIIKEISNDLNIKEEYIKKTLNMLSEGCTVPFIARYRKGETGALTEEEIRNINEVYVYQVSLEKRKEDVIRLIDEKGLLTDDLKKNIMACKKLVEVEDIYRPFKEKKKTKATDAINNGLEPLAKIIMSFKATDIKSIAKNYINDKVKSVDDAIEGASYIIAEWISDNAFLRKWIRGFIYKNGIIKSSVKKDNNDDSLVYEMYYNYEEEVKRIKPHRILAINRGEKEKVLNVKISIDDNKIIEFIESKYIKDKNSESASIVENAIKDSYKRLIYPSIEREIRSDLSIKGEDAAIINFGKNLEALLLTPPMKEKVVLAVDPGFVNGCKIAVVDKTGKYLDSCVIKPFLKGKTNIDEDVKVLVDLIKKYNVDIISIGNGTASRESEKMVSDMIKKYNLNVKYAIVSEAGASIYSASNVAIEEFPDLAVEKRSAVSIARRLQDPLSELVKIPPDGIGVGLYQHDVADKKLKDNLDFVVEKVVNSVGVNINTASPYILKYISGLTSKNISKIIEYRDCHGKFNSRDELKKKKILSDKAFEQAIGFLRVQDGVNILDQTDIHPESYDKVLKLLDSIDSNISQLGTPYLIEKLDNINIEEESSKLGIDKYTLEDIIKSLKKPSRDPRDEIDAPILKSDVLNIDDLTLGMKLQGTVRNVVDFGAFIDIGLHNDGLVHISNMSKEFIKNPSDVVSVGDIVDCYVIEINKEKEKVSLSLLEK